MKKLAIVTGANKGLGLSVAQKLVHDNYKVILALEHPFLSKAYELHFFLWDLQSFL